MLRINLQGEKNIQTVGCLFVLALSFLTNSAQATYIGDSSGNLYNYDVSTNTSTLIGNGGVGGWYDIALEPLTNILYGVTGSGGLHTIDQNNGAVRSLW